MSLPPRSMSKPASRSARILFSSRALVCTNSSMSGWSTSSTTILAARRVAPPDLMVPAEASAPHMNDTGPLAVPPEESSSLLERIRDRLTPDPEPHLKNTPSSLYHSRIDSIVSSTDKMKQLCTRRWLERYSPLSVWMSYTSIGPSFSIRAISAAPYESRRCHSSLSPTRSSPAETKRPLTGLLERQTRWSAVTSRVYPALV